MRPIFLGVRLYRIVSQISIENRDLVVLLLSQIAPALLGAILLQ